MNKTYDRKIHGKLLSALAASERLRELHGLFRTPRTLAVMRSRGGGPGFVKRGRSVAYAEFFIDQWADAVNGVEVREITPVQVGRPGLAPTPGTHVGQLPISTRAKNALKRADLSTVEDLLNRSDADLLAIDAIGERSLAEIRTLLTALPTPRSMRARQTLA
jgi:Bacterial RNA polymerase, alpha chain C terminal domain